MAFPPEFLDELRARVGLVGLIGRRVKLTRKGREHSGLCPFHNERTPSFTVSEDKGFYHCFGCGAHGDVIGFAMQTEGLSFPEAVERLAGEAGLEVPRTARETPEATERRDRLYDCLEAAAVWYEAQLATAGGADARGYLERRGLGGGTIGAFRLGFAPAERGRLRKALNARGYLDDLLAEAGLVKLSDPEEAGGRDGEPPDSSAAQPRDYLFQRVVFPIADQRGRIVGFGGRALGEAKAKYLNSPDGPLFHKGRLLYNWARAREAARSGAELLVVEGYMDVIALADAGFQAAVAPLGTAVTEEQIGLLWRLAAEPVLCLDGDAAGQRAAGRAAERALPLLEPGKSLRFALLPPGEDPDSLVRAQGPAAMRRVLEQALPLVELLWQQATRGRRFDTPERRAGLRRSLRETVGRIRDPEVREAYWDEMAQRFDAAFRRPGAHRGTALQRPSKKSWRWGKGNWAEQGNRKAVAGQVDVVVEPARRGADHRDLDERVLLASLINHPELIHKSAESLGKIELRNRVLRRMLKDILDLASAAGIVDKAMIVSYFDQQGRSHLLDEVLQARVYIRGPHAKPNKSYSEVERDWGAFLERFGDPRPWGDLSESIRRWTNS